MVNHERQQLLGRAAILQRKIERLIQESKDPYFTDYLKGLLVQLNARVDLVDVISTDFDQKYKMYYERTFKQAMYASTSNSEQNKDKVEFTIGVWVFSVIGVLFLLIAFVTLGVTYMDGFAKGLCLFAIPFVFILFSELILQKHMETFSLCISGLGISSLYVAVIVNYQHLHNFNGWIAMAISLVITAGAIFLSRKKDAASIKVISFLGCYVAFYPIRAFPDNIQFLFIMAILFAVNLMTVFLPTRRAQGVVSIIHMISNTVFMILLVTKGKIEGTVDWSILLYILSNILLLGILFYQREREVWKKRASGQAYSDVMNIVLYVSLLFVQTVFLTLQTRYLWGSLSSRAFTFRNYTLFWQNTVMVIYVVIALFIFLLFRKSNLKWISYYAVCFMAYFTYSIFGFKSTAEVIAVITIFLLSKVLSRVKALKVSELVIAFMTVLVALEYYLWGKDLAYLFSVVFLFSILALYQYKTIYQAVITFMAVLLVVDGIIDVSLELIPAVAVAILFLLLFLFNNVKRWRGAYIRAYNYGVLAFMSFFYLLSAVYLFKDNLNYGILTILGVAIIGLTFQPKYYMNFKSKYLFLALFLTYMILVCRIRIPVVTSGTLMVVALGSVATGFALKRKGNRIYGLVLSLVVCLKLVLYDFIGVSSLERMLLFLVVGILILAISGIYVILEKRINTQGENV